MDIQKLTGKWLCADLVLDRFLTYNGLRLMIDKGDGKTQYVLVRQTNRFDRIFLTVNGEKCISANSRPTEFKETLSRATKGKQIVPHLEDGYIVITEKVKISSTGLKI